MLVNVLLISRKQKLQMILKYLHMKSTSIKQAFVKLSYNNVIAKKKLFNWLSNLSQAKYKMWMKKNKHFCQSVSNQYTNCKLTKFRQKNGRKIGDMSATKLSVTVTKIEITFFVQLWQQLVYMYYEIVQSGLSKWDSSRKNLLEIERFRLTSQRIYFATVKLNDLHIFLTLRSEHATCLWSN